MPRLGDGTAVENFLDATVAHVSSRGIDDAPGANPEIEHMKCRI